MEGGGSCRIMGDGLSIVIKCRSLVRLLGLCYSILLRITDLPSNYPSYISSQDIMAEIVGLTASVVAITAAASTALKLSKRMYGIARQLDVAADEIELFGHDMRLFNTAVELGLQSLKRMCKKLKPSGEMYHYLVRKKVLRQLADTSKSTERRLCSVWDTAESLQHRRRLLTHLKWVFKKADILALRPEMEALKSSLQLIVISISVYLGLEQLDGGLPECLIQDKLEEM